ncbi:MAG: hypothetical protein K8S27_13365 [Candidatus Omnitrophica bacterium]|nr:hypothetical protein [Candidatus Omnitrophota bacterium]
MPVVSTGKRSIYHTGIRFHRQQRLYGIVSKADGRAIDEFIRRFHDFIGQEHFVEAYDLFSDQLKDEITLIELMEYLDHFRSQYGREWEFQITDYYKERQFPSDQEVLTRNALLEYHAVMSYYISKRKEDVVYSFGVVQVNDQMRIALIGFLLPNENKAYVYDGIR